ncbi:MAG: SDR family oxidoreductase [Deltaproteobacteria bacterium]|nr:SDR family oxidoreductase [Deltaproteobacteria bacterium]
MRFLEGKRVLVTGGSRGLGRASCLSFARHGARVAFTYVKNDQAAREVVAELVAQGASGRSFCVSVLDIAGTDRLVQELEETWGGIDVLVNNAGISQNLPLGLLEAEDFDHVMAVNVKGTYLTSRAVLRGMIRRKSGVVLNIGSLAGIRMVEAPIHYCASKAAIVGLTEALAKEVGRLGVRVLCLAPGLLGDGVSHDLADDRLAEYIRHCALGRMPQLEEVAELAAFMVSDKNSYMNGATIVMDGGV